VCHLVNKYQPERKRLELEFHKEVTLFVQVVCFTLSPEEKNIYRSEQRRNKASLQSEINVSILWHEHLRNLPMDENSDTSSYVKAVGLTELE
jgi:hypothetical protein